MLKNDDNKIEDNGLFAENMDRPHIYADLRADVGIALASSDKSLEDSFQECVAAFHKHLNLVFASIWIYEEETRILRRIASKGNSPQKNVSYFKSSRYQIGLVARTRQTFFNDNALAFGDFIDRSWARREGITAFAGFPILLDERLIGVIGLYSQSSIPFNTRQTMELFADLMAQSFVRREIRQRMEAQRDFYLTVIESSTGYLCVYKPDGTIVEINKQMRKLFKNMGAKNVVGKKAIKAIPDPLFAREIQTWVENFDIKTIGCKHEISYQDKLGQTQHISWDSDVIFNDDGSIKYIISHGTDLTDIRNSEAALRQSESKLRKLFDSSLVGMIVSYVAGEIVEANDKFLSMLGYSREEFESEKLDWRDITPPGFETADAIAVKQCMEQGVASPYEKEYYHKDGKRIPVLLAVSGSIEVGLVTVFVVDLTENKKTEAALEEKEQQFLRAQKMEAIGRLAGGVAHDFNNLLTIITGYSEVALSKTDEESLRKNIIEIRKAGLRAAELTRQLLTFSRKQIIQTEPLNLNDIISFMNRMLDRIIGDDVVIFTELAPNLHNIKADRGQIEQILLNLAVNAREAMPEGGKIYIKTENALVNENSSFKSACIYPEEDYGTIKISFSDSGVGMSEEVKEKMFEPFFTTKPEGTGLGLSTVYGIVSQFGGHVEVESKENVGTTFNIYFPATNAPVKKESEANLQIHLTASTETILIVEDEPTVRYFTSEVLKKCGFTIITAENGIEGLEVAANLMDKIDLILTDVVMPEMNGIVMAKNIRRFNPTAKIIFMSGYTDLKDDSYETVFSNEIFLPKPFLPVNLVNTVTSSL